MLTIATLHTDITNTLNRLRAARTMGDHNEARVAQKRLDWLLDRLPRKEHA